MPDVVREAFASKKFLVFLATVVIAGGNKLVAHFGYEMDPALVNQIVGIAAAYIVGQGIADHGKAAAEINANKTTVLTGQVLDTTGTSDTTTVVASSSTPKAS